MSEDKSELRPAIRRRRWFRLLVSFLLVVAVALGALWLLRKPLATRYADRFLAAKGVPARYGIADLGFGRQRLTDVVLGDPNDPDLVADWLEARTAVGLSGPYLTGVRGGHVRLRARLIGGKLSFGGIDRLLPKSDGSKPFAMPALDLDVADLRVRLETPYGLAGLKIAGSGRLDGGFTGTVAATAPRLATGDCVARQVATVMRVALAGKRWTARGPAEGATIDCGGVSVDQPRATLALDTDSGLTAWGGRAQLAAATLATAVGRAQRPGATVTFRRAPPVNGRSDLRGDVAIRLGGFTAGSLSAGETRLRGRYIFGVPGGDGPLLVGFKPADANTPGMRLSMKDLRAPAGSAVTAIRSAPLAGTPLAPLATRLAGAVGEAARAIDLDADVGGELAGSGAGVTLYRLDARSRSGARATLASGGEIAWSSAANRGVTTNGVVSIGGDGLPDASIRLSQRASNLPVDAIVAIRPYAAGPAQLALAGTIARWTPGSDAVALRTTATLSGPLGDGRVDGLSLPIDARWNGQGRVTLGPTCAAVGWRRIAVAGLTLDPGTLRLCPTGAALVSIAGGRVAGGASLAATRLSGRLGTTPVTLAASGARLQLSDRGFTLQGVQARLGRPGQLTRLDIASLTGRLGPQGLSGRFANAGGQIGAVPLILSEAAGNWRIKQGAIVLDGGLTVSDAQVDRPRFRPMPVRDVSLALGAGTVGANGVVFAPGASGRKVADVKLIHHLKQGAGAAFFTVPGLLFDKALQPEQLTPVTFGVIADVRGTVTGEGRIGWSDAGVTSTGNFRTAGTDLAAAFGPVQGIAGEIAFTDLLALQSAPHQQLTVRSVNPGIAVTDGVVRLQTLPNARVQVEGARWPFAGGALTLEPTLLDFSAAAQRRMTFRVDGVAADQFLQQFDFKNLDATGIFDGVLPMVFDQGGGRIADGRLVVRPGGGQIAYVGPIGQKDLGVWANIAFQALKSIRYRKLTITMDGPLAGEMVTAVRFAGISQGEGAKSNFLIRRLQRLPFVFNIRITAPFRGLLDATASFYDPKRLVQRNLPQLLEEQDKKSKPPQGGPRKTSPAIQPPASEKLP